MTTLNCPVCNEELIISYYLEINQSHHKCPNFDYSVWFKNNDTLIQQDIVINQFKIINVYDTHKSTVIYNEKYINSLFDEKLPIKFQRFNFNIHIIFPLDKDTIISKIKTYLLLS